MEKWESGWILMMRRPGNTCLQRKNVIKRRTLLTIRNLKTLSKVKRIRNKKEFRKQAHPSL